MIYQINYIEITYHQLLRERGREAWNNTSTSLCSFKHISFYADIVHHEIIQCLTVLVS